MDKIDLDLMLEIIEDESAFDIRKTYAIEQLVAENDGCWNDEITSKLLTRVINMACTIQICGQAIRELKQEIDQLKNDQK